LCAIADCCLYTLRHISKSFVLLQRQNNTPKLLLQYFCLCAMLNIICEDEKNVWEWKEIKGHPGYYVTSCGKVVSNKGRHLLVMAPVNNGFGYWRVKFSTRVHYTVHRLVAEHFIPNPKSLQELNHKDGNKDNNNMKNLEWCTRGENIKHAYATGLRQRPIGDLNHNSHYRRRK